MSDIKKVHKFIGVIAVGNTDNYDDTRIVKIIDENIKKTPGLFIILDFEEMPRINSSLIGMVITCCRKLRDSGTDLVMCNLNDKVKKIFALIGITKLVNYADSVESATERILREIE